MPGSDVPSDSTDISPTPPWRGKKFDGDLPPDSPPVSQTPLWWRLAIAAAVLVLGLSAYLVRSDSTLRMQSAIGAICLIGLVACLSRDLRSVRWTTVGWGLGLQILLGIFILNTELGHGLFESAASAVKKLIDFNKAGSKLVFGNLENNEQMEKGLSLNRGDWQILALNIVGPIIFVSTLFSVLYYFGILQFVVRLLARGMMYLLRTSGAETLSGVANVFMGQTEAPLIVKPYIPGMTKSELFTMMVGGLATISGGMLVVYHSIGASLVAMLTTSVMAAPCALYLSKLLYPETEQPQTLGKVKTDETNPHANVIDAAASGASDGMKLAINVLAMLIAFIAMLALMDYLLGRIATGQSLWQTWTDSSSGMRLLSAITAVIAFVFVCLTANRIIKKFGLPPLQKMFGTESFGNIALNGLLLAGLFIVFLLVLSGVLSLLPENLSLGKIFGWLFSPLAFCMGVREADLTTIGNLLGIKLAANEFVAFKMLSDMDTVSTRSRRLVTFALTGFANIGSIGILIGGIGAMAETRRKDLARLGFRALFIGFLVTVINAAIAGVLLPVTE